MTPARHHGGLTEVGRKARYAVNAVSTRLVDARVAPDRVGVIVGSGRSGTTWLAERVVAAGEHRYCFEPFDPRRMPQLAWFQRRYLRPGVVDLAALEQVGALFSGRTTGRRIDLHNPAGVRAHHQLLVKFVYANLSVGWMLERFPELRVVLLVRHPAAVAWSRMRLGWWATLDRYLDQRDLVEDHLGPFIDVIDSAGTEFERQVVMWCIEQVVPLRQTAGDDRCRVVRYEDLMRDAGGELAGALAHLGVERVDAAMASADRPSVTSWNGQAFVGDKAGHVASWRDAVEVDRPAMERIVEAFGLDHLLADGGEPTTR